MRSKGQIEGEKGQRRGKKQSKSIRIRRKFVQTVYEWGEKQKARADEMGRGRKSIKNGI